MGLSERTPLPAGRPTARPDLASVLWDIPPGAIDEDRHARLVIRRILTAGRPEQVAWLFRRYPRQAIIDAVLSDRAIPGRVAGAWRNILGIEGAIERPA